MRWNYLQDMAGALEIDLLSSCGSNLFSFMAQNFIFEIPWNVLVPLIIRNNHMH